MQKFPADKGKAGVVKDRNKVGGKMDCMLDLERDLSGKNIE